MSDPQTFSFNKPNTKFSLKQHCNMLLINISNNNIIDIINTAKRQLLKIKILR